MQEILSEDPVTAWLRRGAEDGELSYVSSRSGVRIALDFGTAYRTATLHDAFLAYERERGNRFPYGQSAFKLRMEAILGRDAYSKHHDRGKFEADGTAKNEFRGYKLPELNDMLEKLGEALTN
jgi:hypothetical protein